MQRLGQKFLDLLSSRTPILFDGAMGTQIQEAGVQLEDFRGHNGCNEILVLSRPDLILDIHKRYLCAGANVIETNTFGANSIKLSEYGLAKSVREINVAAATIARRAVEEACCEHACLVCGTMGPTGLLLSTSGGGKGRRAFSEIADVYREQAGALADGGADLLLLETMQDLRELRAAVFAIRRVLDEKGLSVPLMAHATVDGNGRMLLGSDIAAFLGAAGNLGLDCLGLNCSTGPHEMKRSILELLRLYDGAVSMMPNAGMPENIAGRAVYKMDPAEFADVIAPLVAESGLAVTGGCCGTSPAHITALRSALSGKAVAARSVSQKTFLGSGISGKELEIVAKPLIVGERLNTQGSKKTKELVLSRNFDELFQIAGEQGERGATALDICVAVSERDDERTTMADLVSFLSERVGVPFCIDSTEPNVIRAALEACPGSALVNSINLERGGKRAREILAIAREFGCPVVALTIDDEGMAKTVAKKLECARRIRDLACGEFLLPERFVYVDPLTFTLATGEPESADAAKISLEALFRIKEELPGVRTIMGVSNVSFGLAPASRRVLNSVMLHYAAQAGLDAAIFNPLHLDRIEAVDPVMRGLAEDLLFNRRPGALADFVNAFTHATPSAAAPQAASALPPDLALRDKILNRDRRELAVCIETLLASRKPEDILNAVLLPAMAEVGARMDRGEMILPFVLQAAEVMKEALEILKPRLAGREAGRRGKIVMATVYGDVHDIGKNLVSSILANQGYEVVDLGRQVPLDAIMAAVKAEKPDALGLSALLVTTSREMGACVAEFDRLGLRVPVLVGGAAVNREFAQRIAVLDKGRAYRGGVYFAKDAFEAAKVLDEIRKRGPAPSGEPATAVTGARDAAPAIATPEPLSHPEIVSPQFYGTSQVLHWDSDKLLAGIDTHRLFKGYFGGGNLGKEEFVAAAEKEFMPAFESLKREILSQGLLDAAGMYGIFPVFADDIRLFVLDPSDFHTQLAEFVLPRMPKKNRSIADYFRPDGDVLAVQIVTIGKDIDELRRRFMEAENKLTHGFYCNGLANFLTEILADKTTAEVRRVMYIAPDRGRRYSFGYPGLPGVEHQSRLFEILGVEERLGVSLTTGFQMVPEHSTMGIFVHHPQAEYL
ncbi:MAG TPA: homocysteine S-methyltransferase family protein [Chitinivibrionales bacterium]|jgi:5-methyltetrahydrofolate--homocysteine methyltransferase|nr:homocysteine S-methyltransferase family protein [Chitinivibrionales bacterium]